MNRNEHSETEQEREEGSRFSKCVTTEQVQNHITQNLFNGHFCTLSPQRQLLSFPFPKNPALDLQQYGDF